MYDYLKDHALQNVWCTPDQDNQLILRPAKLTPPGGAIHRHRVMWRNVLLPDDVSTWHVYQVGQLHPKILGLLPNVNEWQKFSDACNANKMIVDLYTGKGMMLPRFDSYYMYNSDRDLIIAVKQNNKLPLDLNTEAIYLRVYTNAFFDSSRASNVNDFIRVQGIIPDTTQNIIDFQNLYNTYVAKPGLTMAFVNGVRVTQIDLIQGAVGDVMEFVYDSSVKKVVDFLVEDLRAFQSILDSKLKYLLHYSGVDSGTIDYRDDIDVYIIDPYTSGRFRGLLFHKNVNDALRQVTHRDYSIPTGYVAGYTAPFNALSTGGRTVLTSALHVRLQIRKAGYDRVLIDEANRISELYKMSDDNVVRAMLGLDSLVTNWKAETLENSDYVKLMDGKAMDATNQRVQDAYGYNSIAKIIGDTPTKTYNYSGRKAIDVPYGLQSRSTAYEYDSNGYLLGWYHHINATRYLCQSNSCAMVEMISGLGQLASGDRRGVNALAVDTLQSYRVYRNQTSSIGVPADWVDVTDTDQYLVTNGLLQRTDGITTGNFIVRDEKTFLGYDLEIMMSNGDLRFGLSQKIMIGGTLTLVAMEVPMDELDIFLNGKSLIRGLDYHVRFPEVAIVNKEYLVNPLTTAQKITVRHTGLCTPDLKIREPENTGFIEYGVLSNNSRYDLRDGRVQRLIVGGRLRAKEDLVFSEFHSGVSLSDPLNGKPYSIQDIVVPMRWLTTEPTYTVRQRSLAVDSVIRDYLTLKIPQPPRTGTSVIPARLKLYSPFISRIIWDLVHELFDRTGIVASAYSSDVVVAKCAPYLNLLATDPTQQALQMNFNYVIVHPHNLETVVDLDIYAYRFVEKVIKLYTNDRVTLSPFARIKPI